MGQLLDGPSGPGSLRLDGILGEGAFGFVLSATDLTTGERVAVKFPKVFDLSSLDPEEMQAFRNDVMAASAVEHPNVVRVLHVQAEPNAGLPYLAMEYVDGGTLEELLDGLRADGRELSLSELQQFMLQLINGIEAVNQAVLHRDLHPGNILVSGDGLKITDFGLAKLVGAATRTRTFKGRQHMLYMAPEGWKLEGNAIQIDMYSMGIVFFEMAALKYPYDLPAETGDMDALREMHLFQTPKDLRSLRSDIPIAVGQAIMRLMAKNQSDRFASWEQVRSALGRAFEGAGPDPQNGQDAIGRLLEATGEVHRQRTAASLAAQRVARDRQEEQSLDHHQRDALIAEIRAAVDGFNSRSSLGEIALQERPGENDLLHLTLPFGGIVRMFFFPVLPPAEMRRGIVRFAALADAQDGVGMNYLLVRAGSEDMYGRWQTCQVTNSPVIAPEHYHLPEPFGFGPGEFKDEMEYAERAMHVYQYKFGPGGAEPLMGLIADYLERQTRE